MDGNTSVLVLLCCDVVAPNGNMVLYVVERPSVLELSKAVDFLDVAFHLKVRFGTDVVVGGDLNAILRKSWRQGKD